MKYAPGLLGYLGQKPFDYHKPLSSFKTNHFRGHFAIYLSTCICGLSCIERRISYLLCQKQIAVDIPSR